MATESYHNEFERILANLPIISLLGVKIHDLPLDSLLTLLSELITIRHRVVLTYVNIHAVNIAYENSRFLDCLNKADIAFCDGFGVKLAGKILGLKIKHRYTPPDWIPLLADICQKRNFSIFLLGSRPGIAEKTSIQLKNRFPNLRVVGFHDGYFNKNPDSIENEKVIQSINSVKPDILIVGFGMPLQEFWLEENWPRLQAVVALPVGAALDYISGETYRGPGWMTNHGLEWLARLIIEPGRLWQRYIVGNPLFLWRVLKQRLNCFFFKPK